MKEIACNDTIFLGAPYRTRSKPIIYIGFSRDVAICYVGETISKWGVLGRWCSHLAEGRGGATFSERLHSADPDALQKLKDLTVVYWVLGEPFATAESSCRRGVEYLVQRRLRETTGIELVPALRLLANVRSNPTVQLDFVQTTARQIWQDFATLYMS